jgi:hypothetical protein
VSKGHAAIQQAPGTGESAAARRVVMLGASNLAIHLPTIVETARLVSGGPVDTMIAAGHGRSYGVTTSVLGRVLPGILECGLWSDLEQRPAAPTVALVTDIGNDLLYGSPVKKIAEWVEECLVRLSRSGATVAVTELPLESTHALSDRRYLFFRSLFFPSCRLTREEARSRSLELNERVLELAPKHDALVVKQSRLWYGLDPIHIRRTLGARVWLEILKHFHAEVEVECARFSFARWVTVRRLRPLERQLWGRKERQPQPALRMLDGTTVSLY